MTRENSRRKAPEDKPIRIPSNMTGEQSQTNSIVPHQISAGDFQERNLDHKQNNKCSGCTESERRHHSFSASRKVLTLQGGTSNSRSKGLSFSHKLIAIVLAILMLISGPKCHYNYERLVKTLEELRRGGTSQMHRESVQLRSSEAVPTDHPSWSPSIDDLINTAKQKYDGKKLRNSIDERQNCSCVSPRNFRRRMLLNESLATDHDKPSGCGNLFGPDTGTETCSFVATTERGKNNSCSSKRKKRWITVNYSSRNHREEGGTGIPSSTRMLAREGDNFLSKFLGMKCSCHMAEAARVFSGGSIKRLPPPNRGRVPIDGKWHTKTSEKYYTNPKGARITKASHFNLQYVLGHKIAFMCVARGSPLPHITWFKDGVELYAHKYMQLHEWTRGHKLKSKMEIDPASQADAGIYECHANNKYAVDSRAFRTTYLAEFN